MADLPQIQTTVHGDAVGGFIVEIHDGDVHENVTPPLDCPHHFDAAHYARDVFVTAHPEASDRDWAQPGPVELFPLLEADDPDEELDGEVDPAGDQGAAAVDPKIDADAPEKAAETPPVDPDATPGSTGVAPEAKVLEPGKADPTDPTDQTG